MTRRTKDHRLATLARSSIEHSLRHLSNGAWLVRSIDQNNEDYGEDIFVQIVDRETPTPWTFFIQVKGTRVFEKHLNREGTIIKDSIDMGHVRLWCSHRQPVFYMIWDESTQNTYWLCIQDFIEELERTNPLTNKKYMTLKIPVVNLLDTIGVKRIRSITKKRYEQYDWECAGSSILLDLLREKGERIDYCPNVGVITRFLEDRVECIFFGEMERLLEKASQKSALSDEEVAQELLLGGFEMYQFYQRGGYLVHQDEDGKTLNVFSTWEQLSAFLKMGFEVHGYEPITGRVVPVLPN